MSRTAKINVFFIFLTVLITFIIYACSDDTVTNNSGTTTYNISGTITFADTTRVYTGGSYNISAFSSWFPTGQPSGFSLLSPTKTGNTYTAAYTITGLSNGYYFLASAWTKEPYVTGGNFVLGTHGCDTNSLFTCRPDSIVVNGSNLNNINFYSYIDTSKKLINF